MSRKIVLFDMDDTLVDYSGPLQRDYWAIKSPDEPGLDIIGMHAKNAPDYVKQRVRMIRNQPGWWQRLPKRAIGFDIYNEVKKLGFGIQILTKGPDSCPDAWSEKYRWCREHLPSDTPISVTQDKSVVYGRVLVDDFTEYMTSWLEFRPRGLGIMPITPENKDFTHPNIVHYDGTMGSLKIITRRLEEAYTRD